ncbi:MAG: DUF2723 domain-containing protein [Flavobacteriales bacterium]|nr:DUF2723 domain-containing protein [Flavobacteriales bacterium]
MDYKKLNNYIGWMVFIFATTVYIMTLESTASLWDCGEYITTAYKLEVGHPPGAPLFMMLGRLFCMFVPAESAAYMVNVLSGLSSSFTVLFLFWTITMLARKTLLSGVVSIFKTSTDNGLGDLEGEEKSKNRTLSEGQKWAVLGSGLVGALVYTFTDSAWFSAVEGEVYAMSSFFTAIVVWAIFKWEYELGILADDPESDALKGKNPDRWLIFIFFMIGLSIGVHLLNLLCIPAIAYVIYFRKYKETTALGFILTGVIGITALGLIQAVIIPGTIALAGSIELWFTNSLGMPFNTGTVFFFMLILGLIVAGLIWTRKNGKQIVNTAIWCMSMIFIGYSCFAMIVIRSNANTPLDENDPETLVQLESYLKREQYGDWPIVYGHYFNSELNPRNEWDDMSPIYLRRYVVIDGRGKDTKGFKTMEEAEAYKAKAGGKEIVEKYFMTYDGAHDKPTYNPKQSTFFPRMYSPEGRHVQGYKSWSGHKGDRTPTMGENLVYFGAYQVNWMYWRYFMWNFSGRQSDEQGHGAPLHGNWITGLNFIDKHHIGDQTKAPSMVTENPSNNKFYMLPFILGLMGFIFMLNKSTKGWWIVMLLFLLTGFAIIIYLNQKPYEPRERDYAYAASFYSFSIWVGMGVLALYDAFKNMIWKELGIIVGSMLVLAGIFAAAQDTTAVMSMLYIAFVIGGAFALMIGLRKTLQNEASGAIIAAMLALPVPIIMGFQSWDDHDRSGRYTARALPNNYLQSCDKNAIIFTNGDNDTFPLWYLQEVEGVGTDVRVCNLSLLNTDWYTEQMTRRAYESDPLPISFAEEQYRQHGNLDYLYVLGTNELTMRDPQILPKWKTIIDKKIETNPNEFKAGFSDACTALYGILANSKFAEKRPETLEKIPSMDSTSTYYEFRNLIFNLLQKGAEFELVENQLMAIQNVMINFNDQFDYLPGDYAMDFLKHEENMEDRGQGNFIFILPSKGLSVDVDEKKVLATGIIDEKDEHRMVDAIRWKIPKQTIFKADLMILDMVSHFDWERPIYFASSAESSTYLGLHKYFYSEGLVYKLVPIEVDPNRNPNSLGEVNKDKMYTNLMEVFEWGNMEKPGVLVDYYTRRLTNNYRVQFSVLADAYAEEYEESRAWIEYLENLPDSTVDENMVIAKPDIPGVPNYIRDVKVGDIPDEISLAKAVMNESQKKVTEVLNKSFEVMPHENVPFGKVMPSYITTYYMVGDEENAEKYSLIMMDLFEEEMTYYLDVEPEFSGRMIDDMFSAYRGIFSIYQASQVYGTNEDFKLQIETRFNTQTSLVCSGLIPIRKYSPASRQKILGTFDAFFQRIGVNCDALGL